MQLFYATKLLLRKAVKGDSEAQYKLAIICCTQANSRAAAYWLQCAADQNHKRAIEFLYALQEKNLIVCHSKWKIKN